MGIQEEAEPRWLNQIQSKASYQRFRTDKLRGNIYTAFLNPEVDEDIYMVLPEGVPEANTIVKLKKALYGLKTAPRLWHKTINAFLLSLEFTQSEADPNLYIRRNRSDARHDRSDARHDRSDARHDRSDARHDRSDAIYLLLYVDDMQILYPRTATATAKDIKAKLMSCSLPIQFSAANRTHDCRQASFTISQRNDRLQVTLPERRHRHTGKWQIERHADMWLHGLRLGK